jgi:putative transposase
MGSVGDTYDNALCESFFATLECELPDRMTFKTQAEARIAVFEFIEGWYNPHRRHSGIGYESPMRFEQLYWPQNEACTPSVELSTKAGQLQTKAQPLTVILTPHTVLADCGCQAHGTLQHLRLTHTLRSH